MKKFRSIVAILILIAIIFSAQKLYIFSAENKESYTVTSENSDMEKVFPNDKVIDVNIEIDPEVYEEMKANAANEEYVKANITYNGYTLNNVAIRPKGNSSLRDVIKSNGDRFSFKVDFDKYIDGQNLFGITKINLNNLFSDDTLMSEYLGYEMLEDIGAATPHTTYVSLSINGEYFGLYLSVEAIDEFFLKENYGNFDGELYKPDMGVGSDLAYISDDPDDYTGITPQDEDKSTDNNFIKLVKTISMINKNGGETEEYNLSDILNVDSFLKYLAFSTATIHLDSYQSGMYHNYYLYFNTDTEKFEWITWDLNMLFNNFPASGLSDEDATQFLIDEPVIGELSKYPIVEAVFTNDEYVEKYHQYLEDLVNNFLSEDKFEKKVLETYEMIEPYAKIDPSAFYTIDEVKQAIWGEDEQSSGLSLIDFISLRTENINKQLNGELPSTNNGSGNERSSSMRQNGMGGMNRQDRPSDMKAENKPDQSEDMRPPRDMESQNNAQPNGKPNVNPKMPNDNKLNAASTANSFSNLVQNPIAFGISLLITAGLALYLTFRKY